MVASDVDKYVNVKLEFLRLEFHHFIFFLLPLRVLLPRVQFVFPSSSLFFDAADRLTQIVPLPLFFNATNQLAQIVLSSLELHIVHLQICWFFLCFSSDRSWFGLLQNRVLETQFCFLELEFLRLEIYVAIPTQISK